MQLRKLVTKIVSTQSSQILRIFFFPFIVIGQRVDTTLKIISTKKHKVSRHVQSAKMLIKSNKMFVDIFNIHTCKCKNIRVYLSSYCALRNWLFFYIPTYASSKKNFTLFGSWVQSCLKFAFFFQTFIVVNVFSRLHKIYLKRIKKKYLY